MSYSAGEDLLLARVRECSGFDASNTSARSWGILNSGASDHYAIIRPGAFAINWISPTVYQGQWVAIVEVWQRYTSDTETRTDLYANVAALFDILAYPYLGGALEDSGISGGGEVEEMWKSDGGVVWLRLSLSINWVDENQVTYLE